MQLFWVLETARCWGLTRKRRTSSLLSASHNLTHHLCSSKIPGWKAQCLLLHHLQGSLHTPALFVVWGWCSRDPPATSWLGTRAGMGSSALVAAAGGRGAWSTAGHRSRTRKSALLMGRGLNQPNWVGVLSMELVLLLFILCLVNGKINKPPPRTETRNGRNWATPALNYSLIL